MITPDPPPAPGEVVEHYGTLDRFYREIWGEHVHHGLWTTGAEGPEEATAALARRVADAAEIGPGDRVCDVGSGYGATARLLARERDAGVTAITLSPEQHEVARSTDPGGENPDYLLGDWLESGLPAASFDAVVAIESTEHMPELGEALAEARRVLRPGGRLVVCSWLAGEGVPEWSEWLLLEPICREGRLARLVTGRELAEEAVGAGLRTTAFEDVTRQVRRTWGICIRRAAAGLLTRPDYRRFLLDGSRGERVFALTMLRIWTAFRLGVLRYGILAARRPDEEEERALEETTSPRTETTSPPERKRRTG